MALNYSHRPMSPFVISNGYLGECSMSEGTRDGFGSFGASWHSDRDYFDFGRERWNRECARDRDSVDVIDLLPADPFGMDISSTVTAISGWLEDLEIGYNERDNGGANEGDYPFLAGFNLIWNNAFQFQAFNGGTDNNMHNVGYRGCFGEASNNVGFTSRACDGEEVVSCGGGVVGFGEHEDDGFSISSVGNSDGGEEGTPHPALIFALGYLGVEDLLASEMVCRTFRSTVVNDPLLWRSIHIDKPLNEKITDDVLLKLTRRAQGNLQCLTLVECNKITDEGLKEVIQSNPKLTKLSVPGCTKLSIGCIVDSLKAVKSMGAPGLKQLRVGGLYPVTQENFEELKFLLGVDNYVQQSARKPRIYQRGNFFLSCDDDRPIDIEACPKCQNLRLVYDCPAASCQVKGNRSQACRACTICVSRCVQCGRCIDDSEYEETFCLDLLCSGCGK